MLEATKHVVERVLLALEPKGVVNLDICGGAKDGGLARTVDVERRAWRGRLVWDGAHFFDLSVRVCVRVVELSGEERIPRLVFGILIVVADVGLIKTQFSESRLQ